MRPCRASAVCTVLVAVIATTSITPGMAHAAAPSSQDAPTPAQMINQFQKNKGIYPGYRRNHAWGVCIRGYFRSSGKATRYSVAQVFAPGQRTPVIGRLSIPGTNPWAWDGSTPIRGMALELDQANGEQWRTAMNAVPAFPVATPAANYAFVKLQQPDPATGNPDLEKLAAFFATHPTANAFRVWDMTTQPSASFATERYNSLDSFILVDASGRQRAVRWSMVPHATHETPAPLNEPDYLATDLRRRLASGDVEWTLSIIFANADDRVNDAAIAWTGPHRHVNAGTLVIDASHAQKNGACRDINFNPLVLPNGIEPSDDPLLRFRAAVYKESHKRRVREQKKLRHVESTLGTSGSND